METYRAKMWQYSHNFLLGKGLTEVDRFPQKIAEVSREDILRVAQKYFDANRFAVGLVRGKSEA
jgi:predicted Zn-dependent peptidase